MLGYEVFITSFLIEGRQIIIFPDEEPNLVQILVFNFTFYSSTYLNCVHVFPGFCYHIFSVKAEQKEHDFDLKNPVTAESTYCKLGLGPSYPPQQKVLETWKSKDRQTTAKTITLLCISFITSNHSHGKIPPAVAKS